MPVILCWRKNVLRNKFMKTFAALFLLLYFAWVAHILVMVAAGYDCYAK